MLFAGARGIEVDASELTLGCLMLFLLALGRMGLLAAALDSQRALLDERSEELADAVTHLTQAQANRGRLLEDVMKAGDSERAALARDLHDGPIQQLSTLTFETELALMALAEGEDQRRTFSDRTRIETTLDSDLDACLEPAIETILYRAVQESLINIEKHAHASHVDVSLTSTASEIVLCVADDGVGFDASDREIVYK